MTAPTPPTGPYKPVTWGKDHNFYKEVIISATTFGADTLPDGYSTVDGYDCNAFIWFPPQTIILLNKTVAGTASKIVQYSFNGNTVHGELDAADTATRCLIFNNRMVNKIWFRVKSGSSGPITIAVQSWSTA